MTTWTKMYAIAMVAMAALCPLAPVRAAEPARGGPPFEYMITKINVADLERSVAFYQTVFGYKEVLRTPASPSGEVQVYTTMGGENYTSGLTFVFRPGRPTPIDPGALNTLVFSVRDVADTFKRLEVAGYKITRAPTEIKRYATPTASSVMIGTAQDPNGYNLEIIEWRK